MKKRIYIIEITDIDEFAILPDGSCLLKTVAIMKFEDKNIAETIAKKIEVSKNYRVFFYIEKELQ